MNNPIIDLHSDDYFMDEALRQAAKAYAKGEVPVGAVVVRAGKIIARAFNQVEELKDATAHAEMLAADGLHALRHQGTVPDVRGGRGPYPAGAGGVWRGRLQGRCGRRRDEPAAIPHVEPPLRNHRRRAAGGMPRAIEKFFCRATGEGEKKRGPSLIGRIKNEAAKRLPRW